MFDKYYWEKVGYIFTNIDVISYHVHRFIHIIIDNNNNWDIVFKYSCNKEFSISANTKKCVQPYQAIIKLCQKEKTMTDAGYLASIFYFRSKHVHKPFCIHMSVLQFIRYLIISLCINIFPKRDVYSDLQSSHSLSNDR